MDQVLDRSGDAFELAAIARNCCPAIVYMELLLHAEDRLANRHDRPWPRFARANRLPLRFALNCAFHNPNCALVFEHLCVRCNAVLPHVFSQATLMGEKPAYLLSVGCARAFLSDLATRAEEIDESAVRIWMIHRFVMPVQYTIDTTAALNGPQEFEHIHEAFKFPIGVLRNKCALKIVCACVLDVAALFEAASGSARTTEILLVIRRATNLLLDPMICGKVVCGFINELLLVTSDPAALLDAWLTSGIDDSMIETIARGVNVLQTSWRMIDTIWSARPPLKTKLFLVLFASHLAAASPSQIAREFCYRLVLLMGRAPDVEMVTGQPACRRQLL